MKKYEKMSAIPSSASGGVSEASGNNAYRITDHSPTEWTANYSPDFHHDFEVDQSEKDALKKGTTQVNSKEDDLDLVMEFVSEQEKWNKVRKVDVSEYSKVGDHVVYKINITIAERSWQVCRRYREFHQLHEKLVQRHGIVWDLLPPKKIVGNLNTSHLEKRRMLLEKYLKSVLHQLTDLPRSLISFLEMDQFDVHSVCQQLARDMYDIGDDLLAKGLVFKLSPLQIHCINRRLQLPLATCESDDPREDIGHLYSFLQQIPMILIYPGQHSRMMDEGDLAYNLSIFRSLKYLEIQRCDLELIEGLETIQKNVTELRIHKSVQLLKDLLIGSQSWAQGVLMTVCSGREKTNEIKSRFQTWDSCKKASFSYNNIHSIDYSVTLLPNVQTLDLSHNLLTEVDYLEELIYLADLNLSFNNLRHLAEFPYKIPSVSSLNLAGNGIQNIQGLEKMYSLERLNLANNNIKKVKNVLPLGGLPLLKKLRISGNPFTQTGNHNYRTVLLGQFGHRAQEVSLDGLYPTTREMSKIKDIISAQNNYDVVTTDDINPPVAVVTSPSLSPSQVTSPATTSSPRGKSPRLKKKGHDRVAEITNVSKGGIDDQTLSAIENDDEDFRQKIEKLREHAGDSWLTFYNEMSEEKENSGATSETPTPQNETDGHQNVPKTQQMHPVEESFGKERGKASTQKNKEVAGKSETGKPTDGKSSFCRLLSVETIDLELSDTLRAEIKQMLRENIDVLDETLLVSIRDDSGSLVEYMIAVDNETKLLVQIAFDTGLTVGNYLLGSIRGLSIEEDDENHAVFQFEAKSNADEASHSLFKFYTNTLRDGAALYIVLKSFSEGKRSRARTKATTDVTIGLIENPFGIRNELLMAFFQDFIQKTGSAKRDNKNTASDSTGVKKEQAATNYENVDIGLSFLKHVGGGNNSAHQDVLSIVWVGCLPYLFPDEEMPVCLVMTTLNIFLFRVFYPESSASQESGTFETLAQIQEAMHCFYSFPLTSLREVVVGLFDQGLRIEVAEEGPRGTFVFLTRDASKTSQVLDTLSSVINVQSDTSYEPSSSGQPSAVVRVIYPDENKIHALKVQLQEQHIPPFDDRENLISYCIVYQHRNNEITRDLDVDEQEDGSECEPVTPYLRSLILTNMRLILCDEDYVHWPLPSFVHSAPLTPQWIVDDIYSVESVIAVDLWEDMSGKKIMTGCYGVSVTFEHDVVETQESSVEVERSCAWNIIFQSLLEREQFVRSLASIWKNSFEQELKITKSTLHAKRGDAALMKLASGHAKKPSGNINVPSSYCVDQPEMFVSIDRARLNELFRNKIARGDDHTVTGVQFVACVGCKPYNYADLEFPVALLMGKFNLYLVCSAQNRKYLLANTPFEDQGSSTTLYVSVIGISDLQQVVVGLFDQCLRLETGLSEHTYVFVTRDFDRTNDFLQRLSQTILSLPRAGLKVHDIDADTTSTTTTGAVRHATVGIFQLYKKEEEDYESSTYYPKSEFVHPNSNIKFVYPSDELMEKLRGKILDYLSIMNVLEEPDDKFSVLLYALIFQQQQKQQEQDVEETAELDVPCTVVVSEKFICLINEDHVSYPLPLFANELPDRPQYEVKTVRLISSLLRIEFDDFHSGTFTLVFNVCAVDPSYYDARFQTSSVEEIDACLVTDVNKLSTQQESNTNQQTSGDLNKTKESEVMWKLRAHSYAEREKIFNILSKMWSDVFAGNVLSVLSKKK